MKLSDIQMAALYSAELTPGGWYVLLKSVRWATRVKLVELGMIVSADSGILTPRGAAEADAIKREANAKPIPISTAQMVANMYGYDQIVIYARKTGENGGEHMTTYGVNAEHCGIAAKMGEVLKKFMGWNVE